MTRAQQIEKQLRVAVKEANRRLKEMKAEGLEKLSAVRIAKQELKKITKQKTVNTFRVNKYVKASPARMERMLDQVNRFNRSKWTSAEGREEIYRKSVSTLASRKTIDKTTAIKAIDIFQTDVYAKASELGRIDSKQIIDLFKNHDDLSSQRFEMALTQMQSAMSESNMDADQARELLEAIIKNV